jgi:DNA-binding CsgD family transcriptional regulator
MDLADRLTRWAPINDASGGHDPAIGGMASPLLQRLVDALDFGVLLLEPCGRLLFANRPAHEAFAAGDLLRVDGGRLMLHGAAAQHALVTALANAAAGEPRLLCVGGGVPTTKLAVAPWGHGDDGTPVLLGTLQTGERSDWPALRAFARERHLTASEAVVLQMLVLGDQPHQIAARRGSTESTVRTQIKALLEKTSTHSMRELVVEVLHLPPMPAHAPPRGPLAATDGPPAAPTAAATDHGSPGLARAVGRLPRAIAADRPTAPVAVPSRRAERAPGRPVATRIGVAAVPRSPTPERSARTGARCTSRPAAPMDNAALAALCAARFAWPPAA